MRCGDEHKRLVTTREPNEEDKEQKAERQQQPTGTVHAHRARRGHPFFAPPLDVRPGWTEARFCFLTNFACRSSSGNRPVFDDGSVRERDTVTTEFDRDGGDSTTGDRFPVVSIGDFSENVDRQARGEWAVCAYSKTITHLLSARSSFSADRSSWAPRLC